MATVPENGAHPPGPSRANDYDSFAEAYTADSDAAIWNAYYERPAILALAGDVTGRRILDAGCGSGPLFAGTGAHRAAARSGAWRPAHRGR
jgi:ubiquinone/menaquinone biosynthesis C-methylase UbiE